MKGKLEDMTTVDSKVYVIPCLSKESGPRKNQRLNDVFVVFDSLDPNPSHVVEMPMSHDVPSDDGPPAMCYNSSRGSATVVQEQALKSTLISTEVMQWYMQGEESLNMN
jgi:hypothetical protein